MKISTCGIGKGRIAGSIVINGKAARACGIYVGRNVGGLIGDVVLHPSASGVINAYDRSAVAPTKSNVVESVIDDLMPAVAASGAYSLHRVRTYVIVIFAIAPIIYCYASHTVG